MAPVLAYWDIRGYAQPLRLLLAYTGTEFEDKYYVTGPAPTFDKSCWFNEKFNLGLDFPNLPYYVDENVKLSQSSAILRYLGRKHDLVSKTEEEQIRVDLAECELYDCRMEWVYLCYYTEDFDKDKPEYLKKADVKLGEFSKFLGERDWLAGQRITLVDFLFFEHLEQQLFIEPSILDKYENLKEYHKRFKALDNIAAYMKSNKYLAYPFNNRIAKFGQ